jgi:hypothetical protein
MFSCFAGIIYNKYLLVRCLGVDKNNNFLKTVSERGENYKFFISFAAVF